MNASRSPATAQDIHRVLSALSTHAAPRAQFDEIVSKGLDKLPLPGCGRTLERWNTLAAVAAVDLSLVKLYEGHTDALAILAELGRKELAGDRLTWGTWAAEGRDGRAVIDSVKGDQVELSGGKNWCSGAGFVDQGLITAWYPDGRGPQLVALPMKQPGVSVRREGWHAVGMAESCSFDISFDRARGTLVGEVGDYLTRPGFWQGGAGIAACWYGGAMALGQALHAAAREREPDGFRLAALGKVDVALQLTVAALRNAARAIDAAPKVDLRMTTLEVRLAAERCALCVADEAGRSLGAAAFCRDAHFARLAADLPVFIRQSHGERDFCALGSILVDIEEPSWTL
jgi:hypothetical protein